MGWAITIGRFAGTAVRVHVTFLLYLAYIAYATWQEGGPREAAGAIAFVLLLFLSVTLHEFGHIFAARRYGVRTPEVVLLPIGGVARLERIPENPVQELVVAVAGPAVNVVIAAVLIVLFGRVNGADFGALEDPNVPMLTRLAEANIILVLFNMIPAFPMDGGRVLRSLLAMRLPRERATMWAARVGQAIAFAMMLWGFMGQPMLFFLALFVWIAGRGEADGERARARMREAMAAHMREAPQIAALRLASSIAEAGEALQASAQALFPVVDGEGRPHGVVTRAALASGRAAGEGVVAQLPIAPATILPLGPEGAPELSGVEGPGPFLVVDARGRLVGMLSREPDAG